MMFSDISKVIADLEELPGDHEPSIDDLWEILRRVKSMVNDSGVQLSGDIDNLISELIDADYDDGTHPVIDDAIKFLNSINGDEKSEYRQRWIEENPDADVRFLTGDENDEN